MNKQELAEEIAENFDVERKTIGVDISLNNLIEIVLQTYATERLPELQERLKKYEGSRYQTYGKIEEMEEMQNL